MSIYEAIYKVIMTPPTPQGEISDGVKAVIADTPSQNRQIVLAYPPKVGGTFMRTALIHLLGQYYQSYLSRGSYANSDSARDPYFPTLLNQHIIQGARPAAAVMHLHVLPSRHVTSMLELFDIPIVIAARDILDTLISAINMQEDAEKAGAYEDDALIHNGRSYKDMTADERREAFVRNVPVWYARFYGQWLAYDRECRAQGKRPPLWLTYAELKDDPEKLLGRIIAHVDPQHGYSQDMIRAALAKSLENKPGIRFNKGVSGRGRDYFTPEEQAIIRATVAKAGEDDLRRLGVI